MLPLHRPKPDVGTAEAIRPLNLVDSFISARLRLRHCIAKRAHVEHPAAVGADAAVFPTRASVEDFDPFDFCRVGEAYDLRSLGVVARIALSGHDHSERRLGMP